MQISCIIAHSMATTLLHDANAKCPGYRNVHSDDATYLSIFLTEMKYEQYLIESSFI